MGLDLMTERGLGLDPGGQQLRRGRGLHLGGQQPDRRRGLDRRRSTITGDWTELRQLQADLLLNINCNSTLH